MGWALEDMDCGEYGFVSEGILEAKAGKKHQTSERVHSVPIG